MSIEARQLNQGFYFTIVLKISVLISLTAIIGMFIVLLALLEEKGGNYVEMIGRFYLTYDRLPLAMLMAGGFLACLTGAAVWFVTLLASFRVAGPIYRFTRNLQMVVEANGGALVPIRKGDYLQSESASLLTSVANMKNHYRSLERELQEMESILEAGGSYPAKLDRLRPVMIRLKMLDDQISL
jgi:hypothetical protein